MQNWGLSVSTHKTKWIKYGLKGLKGKMKSKIAESKTVWIEFHLYRKIRTHSYYRRIKLVIFKYKTPDNSH